VEIGVADAAEKNIDLQVALGQIAALIFVEASGDVALAAE
jgi:hypothetical protein